MGSSVQNQTKGLFILRIDLSRACNPATIWEPPLHRNAWVHLVPRESLLWGIKSVWYGYFNYIPQSGENCLVSPFAPVSQLQGIISCWWTTWQSVISWLSVWFHLGFHHSLPPQSSPSGISPDRISAYVRRRFWEQSQICGSGCSLRPFGKALVETARDSCLHSSAWPFIGGV